MDYQQILTIILAAFLAIAIALWIVLTALLIKLVQSARRIASKTEHLADKAELLGEFLKHSTGPLAIGRAVATVAETFAKKWSNNGSEKE